MLIAHAGIRSSRPIGMDFSRLGHIRAEIELNAAYAIWRSYEAPSLEIAQFARATSQIAKQYQCCTRRTRAALGLS
jgi:hypothetical protein